MLEAFSARKETLPQWKPRPEGVLSIVRGGSSSRMASFPLVEDENGQEEAEVVQELPPGGGRAVSGTRLTMYRRRSLPKRRC